MIVYKNTKNVILENVEIKRIMSEGGVLWEKLHYWKKFRLKSHYEKEKNIEITQQNATITEENYLRDIDYFYEQLSFSKSTEQFQGMGTKTHRYNLRSNFGFAQVGENWLKANFGSDGSLIEAYKMGYRVTGYTYVFSYYSKGEFMEEVGAKDINAFPKDGQKGSFWYEFIN